MHQLTRCCRPIVAIPVIQSIGVIGIIGRMLSQNTNPIPLCPPMDPYGFPPTPSNHDEAWEIDLTGAKDPTEHRHHRDHQVGHGPDQRSNDPMAPMMPYDSEADPSETDDCWEQDL